MDTNEGRGALELAVGSVAGWAHRRAGRPNQDAAQVVRVGAGAAIAVCDGCGSGRRSELGATLGARLWTEVLAARLRAGARLDDAALAAVADEVLVRLAPVAAALGGELALATREHLLFTSVVAAISDDEIVVAAVGDGVVALGDEVVVLGPFADNAPPYLTEAWFGAPRALVTWRRGRDEIAQLVLATDGAVPLAGELDELAALDVIYRNPVALERRLRLLADERVDLDWDAQRVTRHRARLDDDTTAVFARWGRR